MDNRVILSSQDVSSVAPLADPTQAPSDAGTQAVADLGSLAFYIATYQSLEAQGASQDKLNAAMAEIERIYGYFHVNGSTVTFDYDEGAEPGVPITDPAALLILGQLPTFSNPPTSAEMSDFMNNVWNSTTPIHWSDGTSETIIQKVLEYFVDSGFNMRNSPSTVTNTSILLFYFSLANSPAQVSGILDQYLLGVGYEDGGMINLGNIFVLTQVLCAHLVNDPNMNPDVLAEGLSISTKDPLYQVLGQVFNANYQNLISNPYPNPTYWEQVAWDEEGRFFPSSTAPGQKSIDALPVSDNQSLQDREKVNKGLSKELDSLGKQIKKGANDELN